MSLIKVSDNSISMLCAVQGNYVPLTHKVQTIVVKYVLIVKK